MITADTFRSFKFSFDGVDNVGADDSAGMRVDGGAFEMVDGNESVRQALLLLLSTAPGERVMRPTFGCDLQRLVFQPNDDSTAGLAIHYVRRAVERWESRVDVIKVDAGRRPPSRGGNDNQLYIVMDYRVRRSGRSDRVSLTVDLTGGGL